MNIFVHWFIFFSNCFLILQKTMIVAFVLTCFQSSMYSFYPWSFKLWPHARHFCNLIYFFVIIVVVQTWEFSAKSRNSYFLFFFLVKVYAFSFLFMVFWTVWQDFLLFFVKSYSHTCVVVVELDLRTVHVHKNLD